MDVADLYRGQLISVRAPGFDRGLDVERSIAFKEDVDNRMMGIDPNPGADHVLPFSVEDRYGRVPQAQGLEEAPATEVGVRADLEPDPPELQKPAVIVPEVIGDMKDNPA
jgi:hypothetical protein